METTLPLCNAWTLGRDEDGDRAHVISAALVMNATLSAEAAFWIWP
jgi:hypothetical protein